MMKMMVEEDGRFLTKDVMEEAKVPYFGGSSYFLNWQMASTLPKSYGDNPPLTREDLRRLRRR